VGVVLAGASGVPSPGTGSVPALLLFLVAAGCGVETDPRPASFRYIQAAILEPSCATAACHSSLNQREGLVLDDVDLDTTYEVFYGLAATEDPELSPLLNDILRGDGEKRMPLDAPLPDADVELITNWIVAGREYN